jgi:hypothetical protein
MGRLLRFGAVMPVWGPILGKMNQTNFQDRISESAT